MTKATYLTRRGQYYYARLPLSASDQLQYARTEVWRSLKVTNYREAVEKLSLALYRFAIDKEGFMNKHEEMLSNEQIDVIAAEYGIRCYNKCVFDGESEINAWTGEMYEGHVFPYDPGSPPPEGYTFEDAEKELDETTLPVFNPNHILARDIPKLKERLNSLNGDRLYYRFTHIEKHINKVFSELTDWSFPKNKKDKVQSHYHNVCCSKFLEAEILALEEYISCIDGSKLSRPTAKPSKPYKALLESSNQISVRSGQPALSTITFGDLVQRYNQAPENQDKSEANLENMSGYQKFFVEVIGSRTSIDLINIDTIRGAYEALNTIPKNAAKHYPKMNIKDILARESQKLSSLPRLSPLTKRQYLQHLRKIFQWGIDSQLLSVNPVSRAFNFKKQQTGQKSRASYTNADLEKLFKDKKFNTFKNSSNPHYYWVPVISLFTGMRLSEVLHLHHKEVKIEDGIRFFHLSSEYGRPVKTAQSLRRIPIADILIQLGLLDYIKKSKQSRASFIFDVGQANDPSDAFTKRWKRELERIGIKKPEITFHSFRHRFRDSVRYAELGSYDAKVANILGGWKSSEVGEGYGSGDTILKLKEVMDKMTKFGMTIPCELALRGAK